MSDRLLNVLPAACVVPCEGGPCPTLELLAAEVAKDQPGQDIVLDRLLDLLLVFALREWFDRPEANTPAWYRALGDDVVGFAFSTAFKRVRGVRPSDHRVVALRA